MQVIEFDLTRPLDVHKVQRTLNYEEYLDGIYMMLDRIS
jgi:hypothetical protein